MHSYATLPLYSGVSFWWDYGDVEFAFYGLYGLSPLLLIYILPEEG